MPYESVQNDQLRERVVCSALGLGVLVPVCGTGNVKFGNVPKAAGREGCARSFFVGDSKFLVFASFAYRKRPKADR